MNDVTLVCTKEERVQCASLLHRENHVCNLSGGSVIEVVVTDYDFKVHISTSGAHLREWLGFTSHTVFLLNGEFDIVGVCVTKFASRTFIMH